MRALDDSLRGLPPAPAGKGNGRAGGKEQVPRVGEREDPFPRRQRLVLRVEPRVDAEPREQRRHAGERREQ